MLVFLLSSLVQSAKIEQASLSLDNDSYVILQVTAYYLSFQPVVQIPSGGSISIEFPISGYPNPPTDPISCSITGVQSPQTVLCRFNSNALRVTGCFPSSLDSSSQLQTITLQFNDIQNPLGAMTYSFSVYTYSATQSTLDFTQDLSLTILPKTLSNASLSIDPNNSIAGKYTEWTVEFTPTINIPADDGYVRVTFPQWSSISGVSQKYCNGAVTCVSEQNLPSAIVCACQDDGTLWMIPQADVIGLTRFKVLNLRNPPSTKSVSGFAVASVKGFGTIEVSESLSLQVTQGGELRIKTLSRSNFQVNSLSVYTFDLECPNPIPQSGILSITFPQDEVRVSSSFTQEVKSIFGLQPTTTNFSVNSNIVTLNGRFASDLNERAALRFEVRNVQNAPSVKPSGLISVDISTSAGFKICVTSNTTGQSVTATSGKLSNLTVTPGNLIVGSLTSYAFSFQTVDWMTIKGAISITPPPSITIQSRSNQDCSVSTNGISKIAKCSTDSTNKLLITQPLNADIAQDGQTYTITFTIGNVKNPGSVQQSQNFQVKTFWDTEFLYLISTVSNGKITAEAAQLKSAQVIPANKSTGQVIQYTFRVETANAIPAGGNLVINFPVDEVKVADIASICTDLIGFAQGAICSNTTYSIKVNNGFPTQFSPGVLQFSIIGIQNPPTTKPTEIFTIQTLTNNYVIDQLATITIQMDSPSAFESISIQSLNSVVGELSTMRFTIDPFNPIYNGSTITIQSPSQVLFPTSPECTSTSPTITNLACSLINTDLQLTIALQGQSTKDSFVFEVKNVQNPMSTEATSSFAITSKTGQYFIDRTSSNLSLQLATPAVLQSASVTPNRTGINETTFYTFQIETQISIPQGGKVDVQLPSQVTITNSYKCQIGSQYENCKNIGSNVIRISAFNTAFPPGSLSFKIEGLRNYSQPIATDAVVITTITANNGKIEENRQKVIVFECYAPCETCQDLPDKCLSCIKDQSNSKPYFWDGGCHFTCQDGFTDLGSRTCQQCDSNCKTCETELDNCLSCYQNTPTPYLLNNQCIESCPTNYFIDSNLQCQPCNQNCTTCQTSSTNCTSCPSFQRLYKGTCVDSCPLNTTIQVDRECFDCDQTCLNCSQTTTNCTKCDADRYKFGNTCVQECDPDTTITSEATRECFQCSNPCKTCEVEVSQCTSCVSNYSLLDEICIAVCPSGYTSIAGECQKCVSECKECKDEIDYCTECSGNLFYYDGRCVAKCPDSITVPIESECISCLEGCQSCQGSPDFCLSCDQGLSYYDHQCLSSCPLKHINISGNCVACDASCGECQTSPSNCISCSGDRFFYDGQCVESCPAANTAKVGNQCVACEPPCVTCEDSVNFCTACETGKVIFEGKCYESCPSGYEVYQNVCQESQLSDGECAKGCTLQKQQNTVCDAECNVAACDYDTSLCLSNPLGVVVPEPEYDDDIQFEKDPFATSICAFFVIIFVFIGKFLGKQTIFAHSAVGLLSIVEVCSWAVVLGALCLVEDAHGRELIESEVFEVEISFIVVLSLMLVHFAFNLMFLLFYYFTVIQRDPFHRDWIRQHRGMVGVGIALSSLFSFKWVNVFICQILQLSCTNAIFESKSRMYKLILGFTLLSIIFTSLPIIGAMVYIITEFSTGNIVWIMALDSLIVTTLVLLLSIFNILAVNTVITQDAKRVNLISVSIGPPQFQKESLNLEHFKVYPNAQRDLIRSVSLETDAFRTSQTPPSSYREQFQEPESENFTGIKQIDEDDEESNDQTTLAFQTYDQNVSFSQEMHSNIIERGEGTINWELDDSREFFDEENEPQILDRITDEKVLDLKTAIVDDYDLECIIVRHKPSGLQILVKKSFNDAKLVDDSNRPIYQNVELEDFEISTIDQDDVRYAILQNDDGDMVKALREFKNSKIIDVQLRVGENRWIIGRTVQDEKDFDFMNADIDRRIPEIVYATHLLTGLKVKIYKSFVGFPKLDPSTGRQLLAENFVDDYDPETVQIDMGNPHFATMVVDGKITRVRRDFIGGVILDVFHDDFVQESSEEEEEKSFEDQQSFEPQAFEESQGELSFSQQLQPAQKKQSSEKQLFKSSRNFKNTEKIYLQRLQQPYDSPSRKQSKRRNEQDYKLDGSFEHSSRIVDTDDLQSIMNTKEI